MATIQNIITRINELASRVGRFSIGKSDLFGLLSDLANRQKATERNMTNLSIRKLYNSVAAMMADVNPLGDDGDPILAGQLVLVNNIADGKGVVYRYDGDGWSYSGEIGSIDVRPLNNIESQNAILYGDIITVSNYTNEGFDNNGNVIEATASKLSEYLYDDSNDLYVEVNFGGWDNATAYKSTSAPTIVVYDTNYDIVKLLYVFGKNIIRVPLGFKIRVRVSNGSLVSDGYVKLSKEIKIVTDELFNLKDRLINNTGNSVPTISSDCSDFIQLFSTNTISYNLIGRYTTNIISFYNSNKLFISGISGNALDSNKLKSSDFSVGAIIPPDEAVYVRFSSYNESWLASQDLNAEDLSVFQYGNPALNKNTSYLYGQIFKINDEVGNLQQDFERQFSKKGCIIKYDGTVVDALTLDVTPFIPIIGQELIYYSLITHVNSLALAFYSSPTEESFISGIAGSVEDTYSLSKYDFLTGAIIPPNGAAYVRLCNFKLSHLVNADMPASSVGYYQRGNNQLKSLDGYLLQKVATGGFDEIRDVPDNIGVFNAIRKAYQMTDLKFMPKLPLKYNIGTYPAAVEQTGLIYSSVKETNTFVGADVSLHTFMTAVNNERSLLYTEDVSKEPYHGFNSTAYYGTVCSGLVGYAYGMKINYRTYDFVIADFMEKVEDQSAYGIKLADFMWQEGHTALVTDIRRNARGVITLVEMCEAAQAGCRRFYKDASGFNQMLIDGDWVIYRNRHLYKNNNYEALSEFVAVEDEVLVPYKYNDLICTHKGDRANYIVNEDVIINVASGYISLEIYKDEVLFNTINLGQEIDINIGPLPYGDYKARLIKAEEVSEFTYFKVVDVNVSADRNNNRIYFSSGNAIPYYFEFCDISGFRSEEYIKIETHEFSPSEIANGYIDVVPPSSIPDIKGRIYSFAKVHFLNDYGMVINIPIDWFN